MQQSDSETFIGSVISFYEFLFGGHYMTFFNFIFIVTLFKRHLFYNMNFFQNFINIADHLRHIFKGFLCFKTEKHFKGLFKWFF